MCMIHEEEGPGQARAKENMNRVLSICQPLLQELPTGDIILSQEQACEAQIINPLRKLTSKEIQ